MRNLQGESYEVLCLVSSALRTALGERRPWLIVQSLTPTCSSMHVSLACDASTSVACITRGFINLTEILHLKGKQGFPLLLMIKPSIKSLAYGGSSPLASGLLARIILRDFARIAEYPVSPVSGGLRSQQIELGRFFFISSEPGLHSGAESSIVDCLNKASLVPKGDVGSKCLNGGARLAGLPRSQARGRIANLRIDN